MNERTFRTKDRLCVNCGRGLLEHEHQIYCPEPAAAPPAGGGERRGLAELIRRIRSAVEVSVDYDHWGDDRELILFLCDKALEEAGTGAPAGTPSHKQEDRASVAESTVYEKSAAAAPAGTPPLTQAERDRILDEMNAGFAADPERAVAPPTREGDQ